MESGREMRQNRDGPSETDTNRGIVSELQGQGQTGGVTETEGRRERASRELPPPSWSAEEAEAF